ncbi:hypothetical protein P7C73_g1660, partial [Tremellales sp. Uapishka_1]
MISIPKDGYGRPDYAIYEKEVDEDDTSTGHQEWSCSPLRHQPRLASISQLSSSLPHLPLRAPKMSYFPATPASGGILPYWMLLTAVAASYNAVQCYFIIWQAKEVYQGKAHEMTPLAARLFASWGLVAAFVRGTAAYNLSNAPVYYLAMATYAFAGLHFTSEMLLFGSVKPGRASLGPFVVAFTSTTWMYLQSDYYLGK